MVDTNVGVKKKIAIYARYSSEGQNPQSVEDQIALCKSYLGNRKIDGAPLIFSDSAITGSTMNRPGLKALLEAAEGREFDELMMEGLDRLSRSLSDISKLTEVFRHYDIKVWTVHEGSITLLHVGVKGAMNEIMLSDMKQRVRRGHRARAVAGYATSRACYGYRVVRGVVDEKNRTVNGVREIVPEQATVIKRIFEEYVAGVPVRSIIKELNNEGILSPSGKLWKTNMISSGLTYSQGILAREIYKGVLVYNRTRKITNPLTGRIKYLLNPEGDWIRTPVAELRIVSDKLWDAAFKMRIRKKALYPSNNRGKKKIRPFTGFVICGACKGEKLMSSGQRYVCAVNRFKNQKCKNARGTREEILLKETLRCMRNAIVKEKCFEAIFADYFSIKGTTIREREEKKIALEQKIEGLLSSIEDKASAKTIMPIVRQCQLELDRLNKDLKCPIFTDTTSATIKSKLRKIIVLIQQDFEDINKMASIHTMFHAIIERIVLRPRADSSRGEAIEISLKRDGWVEFYREAEYLWPDEELW